uniref:Importin-13 n=1 Tax=Aceria tosichella TaxID=561515 RepID=A0A6G1S495_9ACAR
MIAGDALARQAQDCLVASQNNDVHQLIHLVNLLYNSTNPEEQNEANRQLTELQSSDDAWRACWLLLQPDQNYPNEVHFFAANLLSLKVNQSWSQYNQEWLEKELRPKLFEIIVKYASSPNGTKIVIDRLALALANFALHSIPTFWPEAIEDILKTFTINSVALNISSDRVRDILLRILIFIAEEYSVLMPQQELRAKLNERISVSGPLVFKFLHALLVDSNGLSSTPDGKQNVFKCLTSWTLHSQTTLLELENGRSLLDRIYDYIPIEEYCASACATLAASFTSQKSENYTNSVIAFLPKIANLKDVIQLYLANEEIECAIKVYSLVINFSENHSRTLLRVLLNDGFQETNETKQAVFTIIKIILDCTAAEGTFGQDEQYSDISFPFWFSFFENFYYYSECYTDMICDLFDPLVDTLMSMLVTKAQYPTATIYHQIWDDDKRESFRCYRQDLGDNISLVSQFPRARDRILKQLYEQLSYELSQSSARAMSDHQAVSQDMEKPWQKLEAVIFAIKSIGEAVPYDEPNYVPKIFNLLSKLPYSESRVELYCSVAEMISAYSDWLYDHSDHLATAFTILFMGVTSPSSQVRLMSTLSLKDLTTECQSELKTYSAQIVESCSKALMQQSNLLNTNEKSRLMHTIGTTLAITSADIATASMSNLTMPLICELGAKAQLNPESDPTCRPVILDRLTMLNSLIESLYIKECSGNDYEDCDENDPRLFESSRFDLAPQKVEAIQPAIGLLRQLVPILLVIAEKYRSDEDIMDKISGTIKRSAKSLSIELKPLLNDLVSLVVNAYDPMVNSSILEALIPLYFVFKVDKNIWPFFRDAFARLSDKTLEVCLTTSLRQLSTTVEKYFNFANSVFKKFPDFLTEQPTPINIEYIFRLALASLELPEKRTLTEVCNFLALYRQKSLGVEHLHRIFVEHLDLLLNNVFNIFGGNYSTPRNAIETVTDMLFYVTDAPETKGSLQRIVAQDKFPTPHASREQKARFVSRLAQERNRRKYKECCNEFVMTVRNLKRST